LDLRGTLIKDLPNLQSVDDILDLQGTKIESLPNLQSVGDYLDIRGTQIESLPKLQYVGSNLWLNKYVFEKNTYEEIRGMINVGGRIIR
jgi:Leucine-rich repeat (LRR) protein